MITSSAGLARLRAPFASVPFGRGDVDVRGFRPTGGSGGMELSRCPKTSVTELSFTCGERW
jgi:hypothetical protein